MTTYYVDTVNGNDSNNGLGPDATTGNTNKPFKTIGKLIAASGAMASGDTAYLAPGTFREVVTISLAPSAETKIIGDPSNAQGFKTSAGVRVAAGPVVHSAFLTNDKTAGSGSALLTATSKNFYTWQNIFFVCAGAKFMNITTSHDWKMLDCATCGPNGASFTTTFGQAMNITIDRCSIMIAGGNSVPLLFTAATGSGSDYDLNVRITNTIFFTCAGNPSISISATGASAQFPGGVIARNCTFFGPAMANNGSIRNSTSIPSAIYNSVIMNNTGTVAIVAGNSGSILEDYNIIYGSGRTTVTAGTHTNDGVYAPLFHFGQERIWGANNRPIGAPMSGSPWLGFGNDGSQTAYDLRNYPRPAGGASGSPGVGALERGNTWVQETGTVHSGSNAISSTGPGYQDFDIPVDATSTTITVYMRYDSTYAGTRPQFSVLNGEECGVTATSVTATTGALNGWEQQTLTFTPTSKGIVTVRVQSNDTNGGGKAFADTFAVA